MINIIRKSLTENFQKSSKRFKGGKRENKAPDLSCGDYYYF